MQRLIELSIAGTLIAGIVGCAKDFKGTITPTGQGGVSVSDVAITNAPPTPSQASVDQAKTESDKQTARADAEVAKNTELQAKIDTLEAKQKTLWAEINRLKQEQQPKP